MLIDIVPILLVADTVMKFAQEPYFTPIFGGWLFFEKLTGKFYLSGERARQLRGSLRV